MKYFLLLILSAVWNLTNAQKASTGKAPTIPCNGDVGTLPGRYTDHSNPKYPSSLRGAGQEKTAMIKQLIALEKVEENSRNAFQITGCEARVSFSGGDKNKFGKHTYNSYGYQLGIYKNVCHVTERTVKTVGEYRTVLRVDVNPALTEGGYYGEGGDFYVTSKTVRYDLPIDAKMGANYYEDRINNRSRIAQFISEGLVLARRSDNYSAKEQDFLKLINGDGYVENWMHGSRNDRITPQSYRWIDRHYMVTKPGIPLLVPVTRKEYLEALLEYYEIEKANFIWAVADKMKNSPGSLSVCEADKLAYQKIFENKKEKVKQLLAGQKTEWLQKQAVVRGGLKGNDYSAASNGLLDFTDFHDGEEKSDRLYQYNPKYFEMNANQFTKPVFMEVQFRYELGEDCGYSESFFNNFLRNYDMNALKKMVE